jgi:hypothetical protein
MEKKADAFDRAAGGLDVLRYTHGTLVQIERSLAKDPDALSRVDRRIINALIEAFWKFQLAVRTPPLAFRPPFSLEAVSPGSFPLWGLCGVSS